jgi:hypothetical protein
VCSLTLQLIGKSNVPVLSAIILLKLSLRSSCRRKSLSTEARANSSIIEPNA